MRDPLSIAGIVLALLGVGLRLWSAGVIRKSETLATTGPYALTRHPLYLGSLLLACGFLMTIGSLRDVVIVIAAALVLCVPSILAEERLMREKLGAQWLEYTKQTAVIFPKTLSALKAVWTPWSFALWVRNHEYWCVAGAAAALAALYFWPSLRSEG